MTLGQAQEQFFYMLGDLATWCRAQGIKARPGELWRPDGKGHRSNSNHYIKLAIDIAVLIPGTSKEDLDKHRRMHDCWDALGGAPRIEADLNHYAVVWKGSW